MRFFNSLIATSLLFVFLGVDIKTPDNQAANPLLSSPEEHLISAKRQPRKGKPPHRGSGRREFVKNIDLAVKVV